jgi:hypothetical protein
MAQKRLTAAHNWHKMAHRWLILAHGGAPTTTKNIKIPHPARVFSPKSRKTNEKVFFCLPNASFSCPFGIY